MSTTDRLGIFNTLRTLTAEDFNKLVFALNPPSGLMPGPNAPQSDRTRALLEWAESPTGRGLAEVNDLLDLLESLPAPPPSSPYSLTVGQLTVYLSQTPTAEAAAPVTALGDNPYQGLKAFREADGDRFFGRDRHIQDLWQRFQALHSKPDSIRILPIYGPSGSGKSSLARAGLIPALGQRPLPGRDRGRVAVLTPGTHPLEALATVLARIATQDLTPVAKAQEFETVLLQTASNQRHDGLRRIAGVFPDSDALPLIVLVDQFEELYTLCDDEAERCAFVDNLLVAACDRAQQVSVILTMRSDFLGATQNHPQLNQLFSSQGFLVPSMTPEDLAVAIAAPAKQAGYELDKSTVQLLVHEAQGQEGALPLLQFALTQIWEGLRQGIEPADTLERIGGVGGAVATEAQRIYHGLSEEEQQIARCIFLSLIQLNDDKTATRRRATISELITEKSNEPKVRTVIHQFARPGVWILVTSANQQQIEIVEVAHEALIQNWKELCDWLNKQWGLLCQKRKIEQAAEEWEKHQRSYNYLLQGRALHDARFFVNLTTLTADIEISKSAHQLINRSLLSKKIKIAKSIVMMSIFPIMGTLIFLHFLILNLAHSAFFENSTCVQNPHSAFFLKYLLISGKRDRLEEINLCGEKLIGTKLQRASLWRANFYRAILANASFENSDLKEANFEGADLMGVDFNNSFLEDANFKNSYLFMTKLQGSIGLTENQLVNSLLCQTKLPSTISLNPDRDCERVRQIMLEGGTFN